NRPPRASGCTGSGRSTPGRGCGSEAQKGRSSRSGSGGSTTWRPGRARPMRVDREGGALTIGVDSEAETARVGRAIAEAVGPGVVLAMVGPLGAGKTRVARAIAEAMGVDPGAIASPTFVLIHEYEGRLPVYHFDTYRLDDPDAF